MTAELIIAPEAQHDVDEAYSWYEDRRPGLGEGVSRLCGRLYSGNLSHA